jgi:hypothetical protein
MIARQRKGSDSQANLRGEILTIEDVARYLVCVPSPFTDSSTMAKFPLSDSAAIGDSDARKSIRG